MAKRKTTKSKRQYKVTVLTNTFVEGRFRTAGDEVKVSKSYWNRVQTERDCQLKAI